MMPASPPRTADAWPGALSPACSGQSPPETSHGTRDKVQTPDHSSQDLRTRYYLLLQAPFALPSPPPAQNPHQSPMGLLSLGSPELIPIRRPYHDRPMTETCLSFRSEADITGCLRATQSHTSTAAPSHTHAYIFLFSAQPCSLPVTGLGKGMRHSSAQGGVRSLLGILGKASWLRDAQKVVPPSPTGCCHVGGDSRGCSGDLRALEGWPRTRLTQRVWKERKTEGSTSSGTTWMDHQTSPPGTTRLFNFLSCVFLSVVVKAILVHGILLLATRSGINYVRTQLKCHSSEGIV